MNIPRQLTPNEINDLLDKLEILQALTREYNGDILQAAAELRLDKIQFMQLIWLYEYGKKLNSETEAKDRMRREVEAKETVHRPTPEEINMLREKFAELDSRVDAFPNESYYAIARELGLNEEKLLIAIYGEKYPEVTKEIKEAKKSSSCIIQEDKSNRLLHYDKVKGMLYPVDKKNLQGKHIPIDYSVRFFPSKVEGRGVIKPLFSDPKLHHDEELVKIKRETKEEEQKEFPRNRPLR